MQYIGNVKKLAESKVEPKIETQKKETKPRFILDEPISDNPRYKKFAKGTRIKFQHSQCREFGTIVGPSAFLPDHSEIRWDDGYTGCYRNAILEELKDERHPGGV